MSRDMDRTRDDEARPWRRVWRGEAEHGRVTLPPDLPVAALRRSGPGPLLVRMRIARPPGCARPALCLRVWRLVRRRVDGGARGPLRFEPAVGATALTELEGVDILPAG